MLPQPDGWADGAAFADDCWVVKLCASQRYCEPGERPGASVTIQTVAQSPIESDWLSSVNHPMTTAQQSYNEIHADLGLLNNDLQVRRGGNHPLVARTHPHHPSKPTKSSAKKSNGPLRS